MAAPHERGALEVVEGVGRAGLRLHADGVPGLVVEHDVVAGAGHRHLEGPGPGEPGGPRDGGEAVVPRDRAPAAARRSRAAGRRRPRGYQRLASRSTSRLPPTSIRRRNHGCQPSGGGEGRGLGVHLEAQLELRRRQRDLVDHPSGEGPARAAGRGGAARSRCRRAPAATAGRTRCRAWRGRRGSAPARGSPRTRRSARLGCARRTAPSGSSPTAAGRWAGRGAPARVGRAARVRAPRARPAGRRGRGRRARWPGQR